MSSRVDFHSYEFLRYMRYLHAATVIGKTVMVIVLYAYTDGKPTSTYKDDLIAYYALRPGKKLPEGMFKAEFNEGERKKLQDPSVTPEHLDITLSEKLIRRLHLFTGLAFHTESKWTDIPPSGNLSIENLIFKVKQHRNIVCHEPPCLTEQQLEDKLNELENIYINLVERVLKEKAKPADFISGKIDEIKKEFMKIRNPICELLTAKLIELYTKENKEFQNLLKKKTIKCCQFYLKKLFEDSYDINPAEWLNIGKCVDCEVIFTELIIKEEGNSLPGFSTSSERVFNYKDILHVKNLKQKVPRILTITAVGGNGKSTYTRLFVCKWGRKKNDIPELNDIDILFFIELRCESDKSFDDVLRYHFGAVLADTGLTFSKLKEIILQSRMLIILDGQDEAVQNTLLTEILSVASTNTNIKVIVTSRPSSSITLQRIVDRYRQIPKLELELLGISADKQFQFIKNYVMALEDNQDKQHQILDMVQKALPKMNDCLGEILQSPLFLALLSVLFVAGEILSSATTTDIFTKVNCLLKEKLVSRLLVKLTMDEATLKEKLREFEIYLEKMSFLTFSRKESNFNDQTLSLLKDKLRQCKLSSVQADILAHYLSAKKCMKNLQVVVQYSHKHLRMHEYLSSKYICQVLLTDNVEIENEIFKICIINHQLKDPRFCNIRSHIIAMLADSHPQLLNEYGNTIIAHEHRGDTNEEHNVDGYLRIAFESKINKAVIWMVSRYLSQLPFWKVKNPSGLASLIDVLQLIQPRRLDLLFDTNPQPPALLKTYLQTIASYNLELCLYLHNIPHSSGATVTHNDIILSLTQPGVRSTLRAFRGRLTGLAIQQLPTSLVLLQLLVLMNDLPVLFQRISHLTQLKELAIVMHCSHLDDDDVSALPRLQPSSQLERLQVGLYGAADDDCHRVAVVANRCHVGAAARSLELYIHEATITGDGALELLQKLSETQVKYSQIQISSTQLPTTDQQDALRLRAKTCCSTRFNWNSQGKYLNLTPNQDG